MNEEKTGRPKEEGGHERINVSLDLYTRDVLDKTENKSKLVESGVKEFVNPKWVVHHEPNVTTNYDSSIFVEGAGFEFIPFFSPGNAVLSLNCWFDFDCEEGGIEFRVSINDEKGFRLVEHSSKTGYNRSCVYDGKELGFENRGKTVYNQDRYVFKFEFKPLTQSVAAYVKDVYLLVQFLETPLLNEEEMSTLLIETIFELGL